jgi:hypothetical protein
MPKSGRAPKSNRVPKSNRAQESAEASKMKQEFIKQTAAKTSKLYDNLIELEKKRDGGARPDKIVEISEKKMVSLAIGRIRALLQLHINKIIAINVTFGEIKSADGIRYGFTCTLTKDGQTGVIPVPCTADTTVREQLADAAHMIENDGLVTQYQALSRKFFESYGRTMAEKVLQETGALCDELDASDAMLDGLEPTDDVCERLMASLGVRD